MNKKEYLEKLYAALTNFKKAHKELVDLSGEAYFNIDDYLCGEYPFGESLGELSIGEWVDDSISFIHSELDA